MRRALLSFAVLTATACGGPASPPPLPVNSGAPAPAGPPNAAPAPTPAAPKAATARAPNATLNTFEAQLGIVDRRIAGQRKLAERNGRVSMHFGRLASLYLARARLSGDYDDYAKAEQAITRAFEVGPGNGFGPFMVRARLNSTLHRLDRVDEDFAKASQLPTRDGRTQYERKLFAGNLAFQRGQYEAALESLQAAHNAYPTLSARASLAFYHRKSADFDRAEALYQQALAAYKGKDAEPAAWLHLQLGLMDLERGRYEQALAHYREGEALMRGYWLIEEHIAEILTLTGQIDAATAMYRSIIERTDNPEFMDAMAGIHRDAGEAAEASRWITRARARYEAQLERFPEAAYGHALGHFLEFGDDPQRTVQLAERNHALRPNVDAMRMLAEAYLAAERVDDAKTMIERALATPMRDPDLHATAAAIYAAAADPAKAESQRRAALAINPKAELE